MEFVHPTLGEEVTAIGGHYTFTKEARLTHAGREVLYLVGCGAVDTSCCGVGGCIYALVPGYVVAYHTHARHLDAAPISLVEPVTEDAFSELAALLRQAENVTQIQFLTALGDRKVFF